MMYCMLHLYTIYVLNVGNAHKGLDAQAVVLVGGGVMDHPVEVTL